MKEDKGRTPLRIILNNFLNHIEKLESLRSPEDNYEKEFQDLKLFSENLKGQKQYASNEGEKEVNRKKNRYKDILPFDFSRVVLSEYVGTAGSDYINANFIRGASGSPAYIASQGPLPHTVNDFWRMVVECEVHVIIMACNEDEAGKHKCEKYWVDREGEVKQFGMVRIRLIQGSDVCPDFSVRTIKLEYTNKDSTIEERTVCQFHYSAWPDHGVPPSVRPLLDMVRLVRDTQASETLPVLVHCSAGCGRTGTICAIDYVWGLLRAGKLTKDFSLHTLVREMRKQRVAMVQTTEQYILVHRAVRELFKEQLRVIDSHPYENIDLDGALVRNKADEEPLYESVRTIDEPAYKGTKVIPANDCSPAPPLPRKNRIHMAASKHEKEVENQTQKQRNSLGGPGGIAKLKAMFERSPVSRSQSLGRRQASNPVPVVTMPCPALPIKRSKSLRIIGSGERNRLSLIAQQAVNVPSNSPNKSKPPVTKSKSMSGAHLRRRRSFESDCSPKPVRRSLHLDDDGRKLLQDCKDFLTRSIDSAGDGGQRIESILGGKGIRERRDSFRQAISKKSELPPVNGSTAVPRHLASQRNHDAPDEVDGPANSHGRYKANGHDAVDASQSNVIIVKPDRASPRVDLYVKGLSGDAAPSNQARSIENGYDQLKQFGVVWSRAATSIDLKTNLRNGDLSLQELKSCLRREGTAHELKARKNESVPVKPYKSLDRVPKTEDRDEVPPTPPEWRPPVMGSPHRSPQTTVDRRNPLTVPSSPHRSPQTTVDRRNPLPSMPSPHHSPQTTVDRRHPLHAASSPHRSPQTTFDRRCSGALPSPHHSPQTTVDRRSGPSQSCAPVSPSDAAAAIGQRGHVGTSPHSSPATADRRASPLAPHVGPASPHVSPQTTVDRRGVMAVPQQMPPKPPPPHPSANGYGPPRPCMSVDMARPINGPQVRPQGPPLPPVGTKKPTEPYSYGLLASVLRRGSQDDLALCVSGNGAISPKAVASNQRPSAPPRIKRHASVVLPRKNGVSGDKESGGAPNSNTPVDSKRWAAKSPASVAGSPRKVMAFPPGHVHPAPAVPAVPAPPASTPPPASKHAPPAQATKSRTSPKKSAASSLSRALGALQLRRSSGNTATAPSASADAKGTSQGQDGAPDKAALAALSPGLLAPTLVINPGKTILPPGIMDDGGKTRTPHEPPARSPPSFLAGSPGIPNQNVYGPHPHPHPHPHARPHPHPHPHLNPNTPPQRPPPQPYQHRHPYPPQRYSALALPSGPPPLLYPHMAHQHPKTHKKQQYL